MSGTSTCKGCGASIVWIKTPNGKAMPCDNAIETVVTDNGEVIKGRRPHWASCPAANLFRKTC